MRASIRRAYCGARLASGMNAISPTARLRAYDARLFCLRLLPDCAMPTPCPERPTRACAFLDGHESLPAERDGPWAGRPRGGRSLDIERPFGIMPQDKEAPVTKHDADRKVRILDYIAATLRARGYPPSVRE